MSCPTKHVYTIRIPQPRGKDWYHTRKIDGNRHLICFTSEIEAEIYRNSRGLTNLGAYIRRTTLRQCKQLFRSFCLNGQTMAIDGFDQAVPDPDIEIRVAESADLSNLAYNTITRSLALL